jgi:tRNA threonylcarbamoyladenosine dehydratase
MGTVYDRTELLIGQESLKKLKEAKVLVVGLGGVGGYIAEALARAGVGTLGLCDFDVVDRTNINRQIYALSTTVGRLKAEVAAERIADINAAIKTRIYPFILNESTLSGFTMSEYDYVADAIDDVAGKVLLIKTARQKGIPVISAMGAGNKLDPFRFKIADIEKTNTCPLARAVRKELKEQGVQNVSVLFSDEKNPRETEAGSKPVTSSISYMPAIAGLMIASKIIRDLIE